MDQQIEKDEGMKISDIFAEKGEPYFRNCETNLLKSCATGKERIISCGGGVAMREENVEVMHKYGTVVLLTATAEVILNRVKDSDERPLLQGKKNTKDIQELMDQRKPKYKAAADITIDTSTLTVEEICKKIINKIS